MEEMEKQKLMVISAQICIPKSASPGAKLAMIADLDAIKEQIAHTSTPLCAEIQLDTGSVQMNNAPSLT